MSVIKFYPYSKETAAFAPLPKPASKFVPDWYRAQPGTAMDEETALRAGFAPNTVKKCMPIFDLMSAGYMLLAPCDIFLDATNPEKLEWQIPGPLGQFKQDLFSYHAPDQYENYPIDKDIYHKQLLRIMPTWSVGTEEGYSTMFFHPHHSDDSPLWAFGALVDTDKFITDGHLSFLVKKDFKGVIKQGTPLLQAVPFKREEWVMEVAEPKESEEVLAAQRLNLRSIFSNAYKIKFRSKKEYK